MTPTQSSILRRSLTWCALGLAAGVSGCSGGGSKASQFTLSATNVLENQVWQINRQMAFLFDRPVDLNSINLNTISIVRAGGAPASGSFYLLDDRTVIFQPTCPTEPDFADAGLVPGGLQYTIHVVGSTTGGATVRSTDGAPLASGLTANIYTPNSADLSVLFEDPVAGPPAPLIATGSSFPVTGNTRLVLGGDEDNPVYFTPRIPPNLALGAKVPDDFRAPLNLYSVSSSSVVLMLELNQPVDPSATNISSDAVRLEYCSSPADDCTGSAGWVELPATIELVANCTGGGATLRVTPVGILPQGRRVRCVLTTSFRDLVGNANLIDLVVGSFLVDKAVDGGGAPIETADDYFEPFSIPGDQPGTTLDTTATLDAPQANWGDDGTLAAGYNFGGTGGPGGTFDWTVRALPGNGSTILNTTFAVITNADQTATQTVINGQVDVRNLTIETGGVLEIKGPNACVIRASGNVTINGKIVIKGSNNRGVVTFNTTNIPEPGASGNGGGGRGGTGNILTTQSTPAGEAGYGPFDVANGGGGGGETGYNNSASVDFRRGGGGGGGSLGVPMILNNASNTNACPDQTIIGLDSEDGSPGAPQASGALSGPGQRPRGGTKGPRPFADASDQNDFWGTMRVGTAIVRGEASLPWPGAGGGGGGNCVQASSFPNPSWGPATDEKGSGGGGGGGSLTILSLGDIIFGSAGRVDASGGTGGGGENTSGINRVGGGSGGGSGGSVVLQTAKKIDFRLLVANSNVAVRGGIYSRGGQGGEGKNGLGGAGPNSVETTPTTDRLPQDHYSVAAGGIADPAPCAVAATGNTANYLIDGCGGDGGPGIIQLHAPLLSDILLPTSGSPLKDHLKPNPVGSTNTASANNVNTPSQWNQLLPIFGRLSKAQSKWVPLGATSVSPTSTTPDPVAFQFNGLGAGGLVSTTGSGASRVVAQLPSILTGGTQTIAAEPTTPYVAADDRTVVFDGTTLTDPIYLTNPSLLRSFELQIVQASVTTSFDVGSATYDSGSGLVRVTVSGSGTPLAAVAPGATVSLHPRFFRVKTDGTLDSLPASASIKVEFQATRANALGAPDESAPFPAAWTSDMSVINGAPNNTDFRFFRFRVTFDISADGTPLSESSPIPSLDFLRVPFRF